MKELKTKDDTIAAFYEQLMQQADLMQEFEKEKRAEFHRGYALGLGLMLRLGDPTQTYCREMLDGYLDQEAYEAADEQDKELFDEALAVNKMPPLRKKAGENLE